jgi:hypothetical protein
MKWLWVLAVVLLAGIALEFGSTGFVSGSVKGIPCYRLAPDQCEKSMGGVRLEFVAEVGGTTRSTTTSTDGTFEIQLHPGKYEVHVESLAGSQLLRGPSEVVVFPFAGLTTDLVVPSGLV